jgi:hypothetical protein
LFIQSKAEVKKVKVTNEIVLKKIEELYKSLFQHDGFGELRVEMKILKRGQKEVIIHCGKQYRYVVDTASVSTM